MSIFDSIKSAFGGKAESEEDITQSPSQMLQIAGIDPSELEFEFGTNSIAVSGEIAEEGDRQKILDVLAATPGITTVEDNMTLGAPAPAESAATEPEAAETTASAPAEAESDAQTYTVQSGDTLWRISEKVYGNGSSYMKIFEANTGILDNPDQIFPGQELVIPEAGD